MVCWNVVRLNHHGSQNEALRCEQLQILISEGEGKSVNSKTARHNAVSHESDPIISVSHYNRVKATFKVVADVTQPHCDMVGLSRVASSLVGMRRGLTVGDSLILLSSRSRHFKVF
jgi:hypothetical protein